MKLEENCEVLGSVNAQIKYPNIGSKSNENNRVYYPSNAFNTWPHCLRNLSQAMKRQNNLVSVQRNLNLKDFLEYAFLSVFFVLL